MVERFRACLFDMDGLLINTEDIYTEVTNKLLAEHGKGPLKWDLKVQLQGRPGYESAQLLIDAHDLPYTPEELIAKNLELQKHYWAKSQFLPGALELLKYLHSRNVPFALATSSSRYNFELKTKHLQEGFKLFEGHIVTGDDKRIAPGRGKPHPDIWLEALKSLNSQIDPGEAKIRPEECFVFEDSFLGMIAGRAAGAFVLWLPDMRALESMKGEEKKHLDDEVVILRSLVDFEKEKYF